MLREVVQAREPPPPAIRAFCYHSHTCTALRKVFTQLEAKLRFGTFVHWGTPKQPDIPRSPGSLFGLKMEIFGHFSLKVVNNHTDF